MLEVIGFIVVAIILLYTIRYWIPCLMYLLKFVLALGVLAAFFIFLFLVLTMAGG